MTDTNDNQTATSKAPSHTAYVVREHRAAARASGLASAAPGRTKMAKVSTFKSKPCLSMDASLSASSPRKRRNALVAWWPGDGTAQDIAGSHPGTLSPSGVTFKPGKVGQAFSFSGTSSYVQTALDVQPSAMPTTTWEAWVYPTQINYSLGQPILSELKILAIIGATLLSRPIPLLELLPAPTVGTP